MTKKSSSPTKPKSSPPSPVSVSKKRASVGQSGATMRSTPPVERISRLDLPTIWVDSLTVIVRKNEGVAMMRFFGVLPDGAIEQARVQTNLEQMKKWVRLMANALDYFPERGDVEGIRNKNTQVADH